MKQTNALSIDQALKLMPDEFHPAIRRDCRKLRSGIDYILFALGYDGILILSKEVLTSFFEDNYSSRYSNNRYPIHIFKECGRYYWKGKDGNSKDLTDCFYSKC